MRMPRRSQRAQVMPRQSGELLESTKSLKTHFGEDNMIQGRALAAIGIGLLAAAGCSKEQRANGAVGD
jgi:hypothetical protein